MKSMLWTSFIKQDYSNEMCIWHFFNQIVGVLCLIPQGAYSYYSNCNCGFSCWMCGGDVLWCTHCKNLHFNLMNFVAFDLRWLLVSIQVCVRDQKPNKNQQLLKLTHLYLCILIIPCPSCNDLLLVLFLMFNVSHVCIDRKSTYRACHRGILAPMELQPNILKAAVKCECSSIDISTDYGKQCLLSSKNEFKLFIIHK